LRFKTENDDAAVGNPGDDKRRKEHCSALGSRVGFQSRRVDVWHRAVVFGATRLDHVGPEELRTVDDDAQYPARRDGRYRRLRPKKRSAHLLQTEPSANTPERYAQFTPLARHDKRLRVAITAR